MPVEISKDQIDQIKKEILLEIRPELDKISKELAEVHLLAFDSTATAKVSEQYLRQSSRFLKFINGLQKKCDSNPERLKAAYEFREKLKRSTSRF